MKLRNLLISVGAGFTALTVAAPAYAGELSTSGVLDTAENKFFAAAGAWAATMESAALSLFMGLAAINFVWRFGLLALKRTDLGEFATELIRFVIFFGLFLWFLTVGSDIAYAIISSMLQLGNKASSLGAATTPSSIVDMGFDVFHRVIVGSSTWTPIKSLQGVLMGGIILVVFALTAVNFLILKITGWIVAFGGIFVLGLGGSSWTSDMAINYFKTVFGIGLSLLGMTLVVGVGRSFCNDFLNQMGDNTSLQNLAVMLVASIVLLVLSNKIPGLLAGILTGSTIGAAGAASYGAAQAAAAVGAAGAAIATGGAAAAAGAANAAGGGQAIAAAFKSAQADMASSGAGSAMTAATDAAAPSSPGEGGTPGTGGSAMEGAMGSTSSPASASATSPNDNGGASTGGEAASDIGSQSASTGGGQTGGGVGGGGVGGGGGGGGGNAADAARSEPGGGEGGGGEAGGGGSAGSGAAGGAAAGGAAGAFAATLGAAKILGKNAVGMAADAAQGRIDRSAMGKLSSRIQAAHAAAHPPAPAPAPAAAPTEAAQSTPESLTPATGPSDSAPAGGSDGGALDGDGGPSEAIGADPGGFGGDAISGSSRRENPSSAAGEVDDFVNRGRAHDAG